MFEQTQKSIGKFDDKAAFVSRGLGSFWAQRHWTRQVGRFPTAWKGRNGVEFVASSKQSDDEMIENNMK